MKTRILHVVGGMNRGGVETWLMHVLRQAGHLPMDFLVHTAEPCAYDAEILQRGQQIIPCLHPHRPLQYARQFNRVLQEFGPYTVIHSHVHHYSGYVLRLAEQSGVPIRIAHSHNNTQSAERGRGMLRQAYLALMKQWINRHATLGLACSESAAIDLFEQPAIAQLDQHILPYGIDLTPFQTPLNTAEVRQELGIPADAFVIGHVGRFVEQKNHEFLLKIMAEVVKRDRNAWLLLVGEGPLRSRVQHLAERMGLFQRLVFAGSRPDVPRLMRGAMDAFVFPSRYEGLGLVLVEAQAAGLPCVVSEQIPSEASVVPTLLHRRLLSDTPATWAETVLSAQHCTAANSLDTVKASAFNIQTAVRRLERLYCDRTREAIV